MDINLIITGIERSPLSKEVKKQIINRMNKESGKITKHIKRFPTGGLIGRTMNYEGDVATYIINQISDILVKHSVPPENGRDTARHIYKALGGKNKVSFEL